jgi:hypothetical protein
VETGRVENTPTVLKSADDRCWGYRSSRSRSFRVSRRSMAALAGWVAGGDGPAVSQFGRAGSRCWTATATQEDEHAGQAAVGLVVGADVGDVDRERGRGGSPDHHRQE